MGVLRVPRHWYQITRSAWPGALQVTAGNLVYALQVRFENSKNSKSKKNQKKFPKL
jgi:hypothetical protein